MTGTKAKIGLLILAATVMAFALAMMTGPGSHRAEGQGGPTVTIGSANVDPGASTTVRLSALGVTSLGAITVDVVYDPTVITATACTKDPNGSFANDPVAGSSICNKAFAPNKVRFVGNAASGLTGDIALADITFQAIGSAGQSSNLHPDIVTIADPNGVPFPTATAVDGSITINVLGGPGIIAFARVDADVNTAGVQTCLGNISQGTPVSVDIILDQIDPADGTLDNGGGGNIGVTFSSNRLTFGSVAAQGPFAAGFPQSGNTESAGVNLSRLQGFTILAFPGNKPEFSGIQPFARVTFTASAAGVADVFLTDVAGFDDTRDLTVNIGSAATNAFDHGDANADGYEILNLVGGQLAIGEPCPVANNPPVANDVNMGTVPEDSTNNPWTPDVSDLDAADILTCSIDTQPAHGTATVAANCSSGTYTPQANFFGADSFTYAVTDGKDSDTGTVSVTVQNVNDPPVANDVDMGAVPENSVNNPWTPDVSDVDGDTLTCSIDTPPANGTVTIASNCSSGTYTPDAAFTGNDPFVYKVADGNGGSDTGTVTVSVLSVNFPPVAVDDAFNVAEDSSDNVLDVLANDSDPNVGDTLTITNATDPPHGSVAGLPAEIRYSPDANFNGVDTFTYTISDGDLTDTATVTVTVDPLNDAPVANNDADTVSKNSTNNAIDVLANDSDIDGDTLTILAVSDPPHGTTSHDGSQVFYTPDNDFTGVDTFTYGVGDGHGGGDAATVEITVVNDPPVANNVNMGNVNKNSVSNPWTPNVSDPNGDTLTCSIDSQPAHGTAIVAPDCSGGTYTPGAGFSGSDSFVYEVMDEDEATDTGTVTVAVVNQPPVCQNVSITTDEDTQGSTAPNCSDPNGDTLTFQIVSQPTHGTASVGSLLYNPAADFFGSDSFTYKANDGAADSNTATVNVTVNGTPDDPVATNDAASVLQNSKDNAINVLANDSDPDGDALTITAVTDPAKGTAAIAADGKTVAYTPDAGFSGTDTFVYTINDGTGRTDTATVTVVVNDPPVAKDVDMGSVKQDSSNNAWTPSVSDPNGDTLTCSIVSQPANGTATVASDCSSGTYTPKAGFSGGDSFAYKANDGIADSNTATVKLTVAAAAAAVTGPTPTPTAVAGAGQLPEMGGAPSSGGSVTAQVLVVIGLAVLGGLAAAHMWVLRSRTIKR